MPAPSPTTSDTFESSDNEDEYDNPNDPLLGRADSRVGDSNASLLGGEDSPVVVYSRYCDWVDDLTDSDSIND